jgi:hypothetical protein
MGNPPPVLADAARQRLVDTWPGDVDDTLAREDWGLEPEHDLSQALAHYLLPAMLERYPQTAT